MTSYDPDKLRGMMNHERRRGPELMYTADSHQGALNLKTELNRSMAEATRYNRTLGGPPGSVPQLNQQVAPHELVMPWNEAVSPVFVCLIIMFSITLAGSVSSQH